MKLWQWVLVTVATWLLYERFRPTLGPGGFYLRARLRSGESPDGTYVEERWWRFPAIYPGAPEYLRQLSGVYVRS